MGTMILYIIICNSNESTVNQSVTFTFPIACDLLASTNSPKAIVAEIYSLEALIFSKNGFFRPDEIMAALNLEKSKGTISGEIGGFYRKTPLASSVIPEGRSEL